MQFSRKICVRFMFNHVDRHTSKNVFPLETLFQGCLATAATMLITRARPNCRVAGLPCHVLEVTTSLLQQLSSGEELVGNSQMEFQGVGMRCILRHAQCAKA